MDYSGGVGHLQPQQQQQAQSSLAGELGTGWDLQEAEGLETEEEEREDMTTTGSSSAEYLNNGHSPRTSSFGKPLQPQLLIGGGGGGHGRSNSPGYSSDSSSFSPRIQKRPILTPLNSRRKNSGPGVVKDSEGNNMSSLHSQ